MKKWIFGVGVLLLLFLAFIYVFIPQKIVVTRSVLAGASQATVFRFLTQDSNWHKWWPEQSSIKQAPGKGFTLGTYQFKKTGTFYNFFGIAILKGQSRDSSLLSIFSHPNDSIKIEWTAMVKTGLNPIRRIQRYFNARELNSYFGEILDALKSHITVVKNMYGLDIRKEKVKIQFLVATKKKFSHYPTTADIYQMIGEIKKYIAQQQAKEEDHPMVHVTIADSSSFETQVAIPVNQHLPDAGILASKKMLKNGNILVAEIRGGKNAADSAMKLVEQYILDYHHSMVAIPFQSLVTDRMNETDSSKWITKIYYPVR